MSIIPPLFIELTIWKYTLEIYIILLNVLTGIMLSRRENEDVLQQEENRKFSSFKIHIMLRLAIIFFIIALIAAVFGFGGIAAASAGIAEIAFYIFLVLFVISLIAHLARGRARL